MAENSTKIVLTAEDRASAVLQQVGGKLSGLAASADLAARAMGAIGVSFTGAAMVAMVKGAIDAADGFNDLAQKTGISIQELAGWTLAARQSGTSMESVAKGVKGLSQYMVEHGDKLRAAGITARDASGAMVQLADLFSAMPDGVDKTTLAVQLFGKTGMDMIPMLNLGSQGLAEAQEKAAEYGKRMAQLAPQADKFNDTLEELALHSKAAGINITGFLIEPLNNMATALANLAAGGAQAEKQLAWMADQGHPIAKAVLAWSGVFKSMGLGETRSRGYTGPKDAVGLPMSEAEMFERATADYEAQRNARGRAQGLLDKSAAGGAGARSPLQRMLDEQKKRLAAITATAGDEQLVSVDTVSRQYDEAARRRAEAMDAIHEKRMEDQRIESEGEEAMRLALERREAQAKSTFGEMSEFAREAARNMQDAFADGFFDIMQGKFGDLAGSFKATLDRMVANAMAARLGDYLLGDFGKTGNIGGVVGDVIKGFGAPAGFGDTAGYLAGVPAYATGTDYVPRTGLAIVHQGERIVPAEKNKPGMSGMTNVFNFTLAAPADRRTQAQIAAMAGQGIRSAMARNT